MPGIRGEVRCWAAEGDLILIAFSIKVTIGERSFRCNLVDRFQLADGLALERVSYFDPLPLLAVVLTRPQTWRRCWPVVVLPRLGGGRSRPV